MEPIVPTEVLLEGLCNDVRAAIHECGGFTQALESMLSEYNVTDETTREVLGCEIYAQIKRERRPSTILELTKVKNMARYVSILLLYRVTFEQAMEWVCDQCNIEKTPQKRKKFYDKVGRALDQPLHAPARERGGFGLMPLKVR